MVPSLVLYMSVVSSVTENIAELLHSKFSTPEFEHCFLLEINQQGRKLEIFLDADQGISFEDCQRISRYLEAILDEQQWLGDQYILEVSSPGVSRPLSLPRQYPKHIGRKLELSIADPPSRKTGILRTVQETGIELEETITVEEGKKKKKMNVITPIPFENITKAVVKISF